MITSSPLFVESCTRCGKSFGSSYKTFCDCGGIMDVEYDIKKVIFHDSTNPYVRYADLLPVRNWHGRFPSNATFTPAVHARHLGGKIGIPRLYLKDETVLPTRSTKDRMAVVSLAYLHEHGVRSFCTSSTGNSSTAYAHAIQYYPDMRLYLFTAEDFVHRVQHADHDQVKHFVLRDASFVDAFEFSGVYAGQNNLVSERGFFNPGRREGLKLAYLEAAEQVPEPIDWYVQAVSSAMGVYGTYKGARQLFDMKRSDRIPKMLCVQQERCSPMVQAFNGGHDTILPEHTVPRPQGIAEAILRGNPTRAYPYVREIVLSCGGAMVAVTENEIREARRMVEEFEGVFPCFSASTAIAGLCKLVREGRFPVNETVLVNLTGGERTGEMSPRHIYWMEHVDSGKWIPEMKNQYIN